MKPTTSIRKALHDRQLLGGLMAGDSWLPWRTMLIAMRGEKLTKAEREVFSRLTGRETEPLQPCEELVAVVGRRGGKSRAMSVLAAYVAGLCTHTLVPGERGVLLCIAPDQRQAAIVLDYCTAAFEGSPILSQLIVNRTQDGLELSNGLSIEVRSASFRRLRGPTYVMVIADEAAFWMSDESANPDSEILNAVRPGLSTTQGPLVIVSSAYAKRGVVWDAYRRNYGPDGDALLLVAKGSSRDFNPSLPQSVVDRALERDQAANSAEYLSLFRDDISSFVSADVVAGCLGTYFELAPLSRHRYVAFVDPSGGSADSMTLAIGHREDSKVVVDALREVRPPFDPENVVTEFCDLLKSYRVHAVTGDRFGGEWCRAPFRKSGLQYDCADKPKSDLYAALLPQLNSGRVVLPKNDRLINQLCGLERRVARSGRDSIDHGLGLHDDIANVVAGCASLLADTGNTRRDELIERAFVPRGIKPLFPQKESGNG